MFRADFNIISATLEGNNFNISPVSSNIGIMIQIFYFDDAARLSGAEA